MTAYCLEICSEDAIVHRVDCATYDLGTLLGLGCLISLGEFPTAALALGSARDNNHPGAVLCLECCSNVRQMPQIWRRVLPPAIIPPAS